MKSIFPILVLLSSFSLPSYAIDKEGLYKAIANSDIEIVPKGKSDEPKVRANITGYKMTRDIISKGDEFYLNNNDYGAEDSRLDVAHKTEDGSYNYTTLHLHNGNIRRATECKKKRSRYWGIRNKYSCYYASEDVCKHISTEMLKYLKTNNEANNEPKDSYQAIKRILPHESDELVNYKGFANREMTRVRTFSQNNGIERFPNFVNFADFDEVKNNGVLLLEQINENIRVCQKYYPQAVSSTSSSSSPSSSGAKGTTGDSKPAN